MTRPHRKNPVKDEDAQTLLQFCAATTPTEEFGVATTRSDFGHDVPVVVEWKGPRNTPTPATSSAFPVAAIPQTESDSCVATTPIRPADRAYLIGAPNQSRSRNSIP